ncbi:MAG: hypothetical protein GY725_01115 [bacterium]|nr:hypothetical protein [bacterium]
MQRDHSGAPSWLYSFVDLAFLLVIALSLMDVDFGDALDLGELEVPEVSASAPLANPEHVRDRWQLRVHPRAAGGRTPFELAAADLAASDRLNHEIERFAGDELESRLENLRAQGARKPLLAPHEDSRSADLLEAVGLLEALWPSGRPALVSVAAGAE